MCPEHEGADRSVPCFSLGAMIVTLRFAVIASSHSFRPKSEAPNEIRRIARPCAVLAFRKVTIMASLRRRQWDENSVEMRIAGLSASLGTSGGLAAHGRGSRQTVSLFSSFTGKDTEMITRLLTSVALATIAASPLSGQSVPLRTFTHGEQVRSVAFS